MSGRRKGSAKNGLRGSLRAAASASAPQSALGQAGGTIQHGWLLPMNADLRCSVEGVLGMAELVLETELSAKQRGYLEGLRRCADSLASMIADMLDYAHIEAGRFDLHPIAFDLRDSIGYTMGTLALRAQEKHLGVVCRIVDDVPDVLVGDPSALRQAIVGLMGYAIAHPERDVLTFRVQMEWQTVSHVHLDFSLSGASIGPLGKAQRRGPREAGRVVRPSGAGVLAQGTAGLMMFPRMIEMLGGRMWIEQESRRGRGVHFSVPFGIQKVSVPRSMPAEPLAVQGLPVMIVDHRATNRDMLQEMLSNWRLKPEAVDDGRSALALMERASRAGTPFALACLGDPAPQMSGFTLAERIKQHPEFAGTRLIVLSSAGRLGDAARCRQLGVAAYLTRPVRQADLFDAVMTVLGAPAGETGQPLLVTRHSLRESRRILRILLIDQNPIDRIVAMRLLERRGHTVLAGADSREALDALGQNTVDLVLVDLQGPSMDGLEVVETIRQQGGVNGADVRIVATTAHPFEVDRQRGARLGITDYLAKPFQAQSLVDAVEHSVPPASNGATNAAALAEPRRDESWSPSRVLSHFGGDARLLAEAADLFLADCPRLLADIGGAIAKEDGKALERAAHTLHTSLAAFSAIGPQRIAMKLEAMGAGGSLAGAGEAHGRLESEIALLKPALASLGARDGRRDVRWSG